ncbi:MAG TPA: DUF1573 domain-containing protein [Bacteroidales bacterium]|nr:DUF1573 domain-containing protein [Bacteroidales bacterium]
MKKIIIPLLFIFSFFSLQAQTEEKAKNLSTTAEITFEKLSHDYGTVTMDASGLTDFKFKNTGTEPLILSNVITTCGCTVPEWPKEPILPGKTGVIKINYTRMKTPGVINKQVKVISNAKNGDIILSIEGYILSKKEEKTQKKLNKTN